MLYKKPAPPLSGVYPFWFWNGEQNDRELLRQMRLFKRNGCQGMVVHSRTGNRIPYLGKVWLRQFALVCAEARRLKMKIWIYDEDGYPSGNVGLQLPKKYPHLVQKTLRPEWGEADPDNPAYAAYLPENPGVPVDEASVKPGTSLLRFVSGEYPKHIDVLDPESSRRFLELTHCKYKPLKEYFGNVIQAVYTDDLSFQVFHQPGYVFSPALELECRRLGRPLKSLLGHLALNTPASAEAREFFYLTAQRLFLENFVRPQQEWCHRYGMNYLGHLCGDEGPIVQSIRNFASAQPFLRMEDIPSVDDFFTEMRDLRYLARPVSGDVERGRGWVTGKSTIPLLTFKSASSIANCFARQNFSSETLAFLGWDCTPDFVQTQMLFEVAQGVNLFTHHASYYTVAGAAKRDCPPSWSYQQPMFDIFGKMNRLWTHIAKLLRRGKYDTDTLVIYPQSLLSLPDFADIASGLVSSSLDSRINRAEAAFTALLLQLTRNHITFDILDEVILTGETAVTPDGSLKAGQMKYRTIIRPDKLPLSADAEKLLAGFEARGGRIISASDAVKTLSPALRLNGDGSEEIFVTARQVKDHKEYLLLNLSGRDIYPQIELPRGNKAVIYDPLTKKSIAATPAEFKNLLLRKGAVLMLMSPDFSAPECPFASSQYAEYNKVIPLEPYSISFAKDNILRYEPENKRFVVTLEKGAAVTALLAEQTSGSIRINGRKMDISRGKNSSYDCGIMEYPCKGVFHEGENIITVNSDEPIYLKGQFTVAPGSRNLEPLTAPDRHGDLAGMGYPNYCGRIVYSYRFTGKYIQLEVDSANAMHIKVNGKSAGIIFGNPHLLNIEKFCGSGDNLLEVELFNQFGNFIADSAPYGINKITLLKHS